ncbi:MAG: SDR family NAD(P)-dependent oxidoreductase, partial [Flavobacteriales bacterium]|nr:SDR family NAD(P)-dependent oxidoreductase [Flavobacteriales bacterium]
MANYLIVGASSGIGKELAQELHNEGHKVFGTYHTSSSDAAFEMHPLDVREQELDLDFVPDILDGVVYCPGLIDLKPFHRIKPQNFLDDLEVQALGAVKVLQQA